MKKIKQKLTKEEKSILTAYESSKLHSVPNVKTEKKTLPKYRKSTWQ